MGVQDDYSQLADRLIECYSKNVLERASKITKKPVKIGQSEAKIIHSINSTCQQLKRYNDPNSLDEALDCIDLAKIYAGVDDRESKNENSSLEYEDFVVLETLKYFKEDFFKWVNKPPCESCGRDGDNLEFRGGGGPPTPNPNEISRVEIYHCKNCNKSVEFPRINSPTKLLRTKRGRCGEWVNCFILVLKAVLGLSGQVRYLWNYEDHVWCEYYSASQKRWIHLDPCENSYDEPHLYCENWGKKMSWVVAIGEYAVVDVSDKYVSNNDKKIAKLSVASENKIAEFLNWANSRILVEFWGQLAGQTTSERHHQLYEVILKQGRDTQAERKELPTKTSTAPIGRQSGKGEWTQSRGENGK